MVIVLLVMICLFISFTTTCTCTNIRCNNKKKQNVIKIRWLIVKGMNCQLQKLITWLQILIYLIAITYCKLHSRLTIHGLITICTYIYFTWNIKFTKIILWCLMRKVSIWKFYALLWLCCMKKKMTLVIKIKAAAWFRGQKNFRTWKCIFQRWVCNHGKVWWPCVASFSL